MPRERCGYTGGTTDRRGATKDAVAVAELLLSNENVEPCGLGARDSLRLEAGLCLYGNDLDDTVNPVEGTLLWTIGPKDTRRRTEQGFPGAANMLTAEGKPKKFGRKRVGFGYTKPGRPSATCSQLMHHQGRHGPPPVRNSNAAAPRSRDGARTACSC